MKKLYWLLIAIVFLLLYFGKKIVNFAVEWMWFISTGYQNVLYKIIAVKVLLFLASGAIFFLFIYLNVYFANKLKPKISNFPESISRLFPADTFFRSDYFKKFKTAFTVLAVALFSVFFAYEVSMRWDAFLQFANAVPFGAKDPVFLKDIGFYVFRLPFLTSLYGWAMFLVFAVLLVVLFIYFTSRAVQYIGKEIYFTKAARAHIFGLTALLLVLKAFGYRLDAYGLLYSARGIVFGASYADVYGYMPLYYVLTAFAFLCAVLAVINIFTKAWKPAVFALAAFVIVSLIGGLYPASIQKFIVKPNEITKETKFIEYNIKYTRDAYKLNSIKEREFPAADDISYKDIAANKATIKNVRLWDYDPILASYGQLQEMRTYYKFTGVDNDRYDIKGNYTQTMLSARELAYNELPSRIWINEHLTYTHGYGLCMGPVNRVTQEGLPEFFVKDIPPAALDEVNIKRPEIYFGELSNDYCFVNTKSKEFDYPSGDKNIYCEYGGGGQIPISSIWKKILFAIKFSEPKILLSTDITGKSKLMYHRKVIDRVKLCAPMVYFDKDIYMVVGANGNLYWIAEGYTVSDRYPYSHPAEQIGNYIRNSVKAVVNAYNGKVDYYISDPSDPIIKAQSKIFPGVFKNIDTMPKDLKAHIRYPSTLFKIQAKIFSTYHMTDPQVFYNKEDLWRISQKTGNTNDSSPMEPYYTILKFPGADTEEFILMIPFSPSSKNNMIAWMAARCDAPNYGAIMAYRFPKKKLIYGPSQIDARIDQDAEISKQLTLWGQGGSKVIRGSLLVIPVEESLLYIEPIYLAAEQGQLPELKRIVVAYKDNVAMEDNLEKALAVVFKPGAYRARSSGADSGQAISAGAKKEEKVETSVRELINLAADTYDGAVNAQKQGNWAAYGEKINDLKQILEELKEKTK